jgi:hypothetical protein
MQRVMCEALGCVGRCGYWVLILHRSDGNVMVEGRQKQSEEGDMEIRA